MLYIFTFFDMLPGSEHFCMNTESLGGGGGGGGCFQSAHLFPALQALNESLDDRSDFWSIFAFYSI